MSAPVGLTHPRAFKARTKPLKGLGDMNERISTRFDNRLLKAESSLVEDVLENQVSLEQFQSTVDTFQDVAVTHAQLRPGGVTQSEFAVLRNQLRQESGEAKVISPEAKALYHALKDGSVEPQEALEELHWKSSQAYGAEALKRDGIIFKDERPKLRAHLNTGESVKKSDDEASFVHPRLGSFLQEIEDVFPLLDENEDQEIDRLEARKIIAEYQELGVTPSTATTFYSRQAEMASAHEAQPGSMTVSREDLKALLPENHSVEVSADFEKAVTRISKRLDFEQGRESSPESPFTLGETFAPMNVRQGREGSCWVLCHLPTLDSEQLGQVIEPEGEQYRVSLKDGRTSLVDALNEAERRIYSRGDGSWSGLLEKGLSQILAEDDRNITGGPASEAREFLTGQKLKQKTLLSRDRNPVAPELRDRNTLFAAMEQSLESGGAVVASALPEDFESGISEISAAGHGYTVLAVDREQDQVTLRNPWGRGEVADRDGENDGRFTLTQDQFFANFSLLDMAEQVRVPPL